jgi:hypothetical protein
MQFENDWPGVFIRGDDALGYAGALRHVLAEGSPGDLSDDEVFKWMSLRGHLSELVELLETCRVKSKSPWTTAPSARINVRSINLMR